MAERLRYAWNHSTSPVLAWSRAAWDTAGWRRNQRVVSFPAGDGIALGYAGAPAGTATALQILEEHRERAGCGTARREPAARYRPMLMPVPTLPGADLVVVSCGRNRAHAMPSAAAVVLPYRVHFVLDTTDRYETARRRVSKKERHAYAAERRAHGWTLEKATADTDFDFFYDRMHLPTMRSRHGGRARSEDRAVAREGIFRRGLLVFVMTGGHRVAGGLCRWERRRRTLALRLVGVLDGAGEHYSTGALRALYHGLQQWACEHDQVERLDLQGTEPFVSRGIFQWKRKFHPRIELPPNHFGRRRLWLHVPTDSPAVRDFLVANPVVAETTDGGLEAIYFHDRDRAARTDVPCGCPGVRRDRTVDLDRFLSGRPREKACTERR